MRPPDPQERSAARGAGAARWPAVAVLAAATVLFARRAAPGVTFEDGGELATAVAIGGVPHPPGFPLYVLLGRAFVALLAPLASDPARALALFSAACAAGAAALLARLASRLGAGPGPALAAGMLPCLSPAFAAQAVTIEVYALSALLSAALLLVALTSPRPTARGALLLGLGAAAHPTTLFLAPALAVAAVRARRSGAEGGTVLGVCARAALWFCAGLLPFLYVPLAAARRPAWSFGDARTAEAVLAHVLRPPLDTGLARDLRAQLAFLLEQAVGQWPLLVALGAAGLVLAREHVPRAALLAALAGLLAAGAGLLWAVDYPLDVEQNRVRLAGSYVPALMAVAALCALSFSALEARFGPTRPRAAGAAAWPALVLGLALAGGSLERAGELDLSGDDSAERYAREVLEACPESAVLLVSRLGYDDVLHFPLLYAQEVLALRGDVLVLDRSLLPQAWYRAELARRAPELEAALGALGAALGAAPELARDPAGRRRASVPFLQALFDGARPVVALARPSELLLGGRAAAAGPVLWHVLPRNTLPPPESGAPPAFEWLSAARRSPWTAELARLCRERDLERARALLERGESDAARPLLLRWSGGE